MSNRIWIDNVEFTDDADGLDSLVIDYGLDTDTKTFGFSTGTNVTLKGQAHKLIEEKFFTNCDGIRQTCNIKIYECCCDKVFEFQIGYEGLVYCRSECTTQISFKKVDEQTRCGKYLKNTIFFNNGFAENVQHPKIHYCSQPGFLHWILFFLQPLILALLAIINVIGAVLGAVFGLLDGITDLLSSSCQTVATVVLQESGLPFTDADVEALCVESTCLAKIKEFYPNEADLPQLGFANPETYQELCDYLSGFRGATQDVPNGGGIPSPCDFVEFLTGCGKKAPAPRIKDILDYHTKKCGLKLKSSIFCTKPYENLTLFSLLYERGYYENVGTWCAEWLKENGSNLTVTQLLDEIKPVFNLEYEIVDGTLCVERKDYFENIKTELLNVESYLVNGLLGEEYCITFIQDNACAYGRFEYSQDALDTQGNRVLPKYNDIVEWNANNDDFKDGECTNTVNFGAARFMFDEKTFENDGLFNFDRLIDQYRDGGFLQTGIFGCTGEVRTNDLIISDDRTSLGKLLVLECDYDVNDAKVIRRKLTDDDGKTFYDYNYPMYFDENYPEKELYQSFHIIDDPNQNGRRLYSISQITIPFDCDLACKIDDNPNGFFIRTHLGRGYVQNTQVSFGGGNRFIRFTNVEVVCE